MEIKAMRTALILMFLAGCKMMPVIYAADPAPDVESLVEGFPTLDELESRLGSQTSARDSIPAPESRANVHSNSFAPTLPALPHLFAGSLVAPISGVVPATRNSVPGDRPLTALLSNLDAAHKETVELADEITKKNQLVRNKYFFDRLTTYARSDYGTAVTGVFANGIGFGTFQQAFRQNYVTTYSLPLLPRYTKTTGWSRILGGWAISSSVGAEPRLDQAFNVERFLNNLRLSWSVAFSYNLCGATFRKIRDGQLAQEAALVKATDRATDAREELLRKMAARMEALTSNPPLHDSRLESLRELYPQFELYQSRYLQAKSCEERVEHFYTVKGLALSLLTLAGYDRAGSRGRDLLGSWKRAHYSICEGRSANTLQPTPAS